MDPDISCVVMGALSRLSAAALRRDVVMGDPCGLLEAKAELAAANKQAIEAIRIAVDAGIEIPL